ncbi:hypothetical protein Pan241w_01150 [Gimesia alba]|uniref:Uncharacterized protein n=1 Tax=Gimesia alba TaxID=2527973 RepID=A0A517R858_9PLAN|nr:hypothetical protein [Gimesia alba]QDT40062.1 hypothetical protein Pan241w_01150 [Gimesia alba]
MKKINRTASVALSCIWDVVLLTRTYRRLAGMCLLAVTFLMGTPHIVSAANEFDGFLHIVRVCDRVPELPPSRNQLSKEKQQEFEAVWTQVVVAGEKLESLWEQEVKNDPLMRRALKACDRHIQLEMQYNNLSHQLIAEYGAKKFREMETKWASWSKTQANDWLDLEDQDLIRLSIWVLSYGGDQSWLKREPLSRFANPFSESDDNRNRNQKDERRRKGKLSASAQNPSEKLSEAEVIEVYKAGIRWLRQQNRNKVVPEIPVRMQQYLKLRAEADYLFEAGETYLRMTPRPKVEAAKQEFTSLVKKAATIRPDLNEALMKAHQAKQQQNQ